PTVPAPAGGQHDARPQRLPEEPGRGRARGHAGARPPGGADRARARERHYSDPGIVLMSTDDRRMALNVHKSSRSPLPTVHIFLQRVVRQANGMLSVTPICSTLAEIEQEIEELRIELDTIQRQ